MKRMVVILAGVATLVGAAYVGSGLWAQSQPAAPAQPRIALINLVYIMEHYNKAKLLKEEAKAAFARFTTDVEGIRKKMADAQKQLEDPKLENRGAWEKYLIELKRAHEDVAIKFKKDYGAKSEDQWVQLYREVEDAVKRCALSNNFHIVLQHNETINAAEAGSAAYILRKAERPGGALIPMYVANGLDISAAVVQNLNHLNPGQPVHTGVPPKK